MIVLSSDGPRNADSTRLPAEEVWLIGEWRDSGERKYYLSNLPPRTSLRRLAATVKARWSCEQAHQQLKQELGLGDFEGLSRTGPRSRRGRVPASVADVPARRTSAP